MASYEWPPSLAGGPGASLSIGVLDSEMTPSLNAATITDLQLIFQSASATAPGIVNNSAQVFSGVKIFSNNIVAQGSMSAPVFDVVGSTSGLISIQGQANSGTYPFILPNAIGTSLQLLTGGSPMTWTSFTTAPTPNTLVSRDPFGSVSVATLGATILQLNGSVSNNVLLAAPPSAGTGYTLQVPGASGNAGDLLYNLGGGTTTWNPSTSANTPNTVMTRDNLGNTGVVNLTATQEVTANIALISGLAGNASGAVLLNGYNSGTVLILAPDFMPANWNFNLPQNAGNPGDFLTSQGGTSNSMTWTPPPTGSAPPVRQTYATPGAGNITVPTPTPAFCYIRATAGGGGSDGSGSGFGSGGPGSATNINSGQVLLTGGNPGLNNSGASSGGSATVNSGSLTVSLNIFQGGNGNAVPVANAGSGLLISASGAGGASIFGPGAPAQNNGNGGNALNAGAGASGSGANSVGENSSAGGGAGGGVEGFITGGFVAGQLIPIVIGSGGGPGNGGSGGYPGGGGSGGQIICDWYY